MYLLNEYTICKRDFIIKFVIIHLCVMFIVYHITQNNNHKVDPDCFHYSADKIFKLKNISNLQLLPDISDTEFSYKPTPGRTIFFHETSCARNGILQLNNRQACAIESAARLHPTWDVFVLFASPSGTRRTEKLPIVEALAKLPNVHLRNMNLQKYVLGSLTEKWILSSKLFESHYLVTHLSDFLRYMSLFKYGGIYLDLDVVVKSNLEILGSNYAGSESEIAIAAGVINLEYTGTGHQLAKLFLREFVNGFNGLEWGTNGPDVLLRSLHKLCPTNLTLNRMETSYCGGFKVYPTHFFYPIRMDCVLRNMDSLAEKEVQKINDSYVVHMWNKLTKRYLMDINSNIVYVDLARKYCPNIYNLMNDFF